MEHRQRLLDPLCFVWVYESASQRVDEVDWLSLNGKKRHVSNFPPGTQKASVNPRVKNLRGWLIEAIPETRKRKRNKNLKKTETNQQIRISVDGLLV